MKERIFVIITTYHDSLHPRLLSYKQCAVNYNFSRDFFLFIRFLGTGYPNRSLAIVETEHLVAAQGFVEGCVFLTEWRSSYTRVFFLERSCTEYCTDCTVLYAV